MNSFSFTLILFVVSISWSQSSVQKDEKFPNGSLKVKWTEVKNSKGVWVRDGSQTEFYQNGMKKRVSQFKEGLLEGESLLYSKNAELVAREQYQRGILKYGVDAYKYYADGSVMSSCRRDGICMGYFPNKKISFLGFMKNGKRDGEFKFFYSTGEIKFKGTCKDQSETGVWKLVTKSGQHLEVKPNGGSVNGLTEVAFAVNEKRKNFVDTIHFRKPTIDALNTLSEFDFKTKVELNDEETCELQRSNSPCTTWSEFDCSFDIKGIEN